MISNEGMNEPSFHVVLVHPDIPHNTGAIGRLCLSTGARLHLVKPLGFELDEKAVKRAGLDYWPHVDLVVWESLEEFEAHLEQAEASYHLLTTKTEQQYWQSSYQKGDYLIFGSETRGLPESLLEASAAQCSTIPMDTTHVRSLNLATAAGIVLYEGMRQTQGE